MAQQTGPRYVESGAGKHKPPHDCYMVYTWGGGHTVTPACPGGGGGGLDQMIVTWCTPWEEDML
jgi:hypothetical protein